MIHLLLEKKNAPTKTSKHCLFQLSPKCVCITQVFSWWTFYRADHNNHQETGQGTTGRALLGGTGGKKTQLQIIWEGLMKFLFCLAALRPAPFTEAAWGRALAGPQGAISSDEWPWDFGSRFWFFQNVMIHHGLSSALRQEEEGGRRSCSARRLISRTRGVARAPWLPSATAVLHADEADNLLPFLTLETGGLLRSSLSFFLTNW